MATASFTKEEFRVFIKFCSLLGEQATDIHAKLVRVAGDQSPSLRTTQEWSRRFKEGRASCEDDPRKGRPTEAVTSDSINAVETLVLTEPHSSLEQIAEITGLSKGSVHTILTLHLQRKKLCGRWIPHLLTEADKEDRMETSRSLLNRFRRMGSSGMRNIVTGDETYLYYYEPGSRTERMEWRRTGEGPSTSLAPSHFSEKVLYTIFFTADGEVSRFVAPKGTTLTGKYFSGVILPQLQRDFQRLHPNQQMKLHVDNAPAHRATIVREYLEEQQIVRLPHPAYSPDLAPADFWLFPKLKSCLRGRTFSNRQALGQAVGQVLNSITKEEWSKCFEEWKQRLQHCIKSNGEYFEQLL